MNKRIQELADQADSYAKAEYEKWTPTPDFSGIPNIRKIFNAKFAELMVEEFAKVVNDTEYPYENESDKNAWDTCCVWSAAKLKEHFGVKE